MIVFNDPLIGMLPMLMSARRWKASLTPLEKFRVEFELRKESTKRMTNSDLRKHVREGALKIESGYAFLIARDFYCDMNETDEIGEEGGKIWRRDEKSHEQYIQWVKVYEKGFGTVDGIKYVCV
jgi:hypothetical protein